MPGPLLHTLTAPDGTAFRDLDHDGVMAPFEDPRLAPDERAADLTGRLSLAEKAGLMFHDIIEVGPGGALMEGDGVVSRRSSRAPARVDLVGASASVVGCRAGASGFAGAVLSRARARSQDRSRSVRSSTWWPRARRSAAMASALVQGSSTTSPLSAVIGWA